MFVPAPVPGTRPLDASQEIAANAGVDPIKEAARVKLKMLNRMALNSMVESDGERRTATIGTGYCRVGNFVASNCVCSATQTDRYSAFI